MGNTLSRLACLLLLAIFPDSDTWINEKRAGYNFSYQSVDQSNVPAYEVMIDKGIKVVNAFFLKPFPKSFDVYVHPTRDSWDNRFQEAYKMPDFKSECWMVASGDGFQLNMISPAVWDKVACEHKYADTLQTQRLLTHELFHVFHGQLNVSPDFNDFEGLDWLAEGFATYASGQLTTERKSEIRSMVAAGTAPTKLDDFWKGKQRYGLAGSMVGYIDVHYGRETLFRILSYNRKAAVLDFLKVSEDELVAGWAGGVK